MTNSKLIFSLGVLVFVVIAGTSYAQDNSQKDITKQEVKTYKLTPEEQATKITDRLNKELNLTSEQYTKIQKLYADNIAYRRELKTKDLISKSEVKQKKKDFREGIKNTLTDDQQKEMKKMAKKRHGKSNNNHRNVF